MDTTNYVIPQKITSNLGIKNIVNVIDKLPVNPRYSWTELEFMKQKEGKGNPRELEDITTLVLHHDGIPKKESSGMSDMELMISIANTHIRSKKNRADGDGGFPYDVFIRNGIAYQTNDFRPLKFGVKSNNSYTLHICVSGDYHNFDTLTDPDRKALIGVLVALKTDLPRFKEIKGHGEIMPTLCPGYDPKKIRSDVLTAENQIKFAQTPEKQQEMAYRIANELLYLYHMSKGKGPNNEPVNDGQKLWAQTRLLSLEPEMRRLGFLK